MHKMTPDHRPSKTQQIPRTQETNSTEQDTNPDRPLTSGLTLAQAAIMHMQKNQGNQAVLRSLAHRSHSVQPAVPASGPIIARKLRGVSATLAEVKGINMQWNQLTARLTAYETLEGQQVALLEQIATTEQTQPSALGGQAFQPGQAAPNRQVFGLGAVRGGGAAAALAGLKAQKVQRFEQMSADLTALVAQVTQLLNYPRLSPEMRDAALTVLPRLRRELADIKQGKFNETTGFDDSSLYRYKDNAVGGALNKLDTTEHNTFKGFYKPETMKDAKYDHHSGTDTGIPENNPNFGGRSVAMYRLDQLLNAQVIVRTEFATHKREFLDAAGQKMGPGPLASMGIIMEKAKGVEMRKGITEGEGLAYTNQQQQKLLAQGQARIDINDPVLQRGLNKLQILDALCAQVDRHNANFYVEKEAATGRVQGVKGIDNDLAFGKGMKDPSTWMRAPAFKNLPPLVDAELGQTILDVQPLLIRQALEGLLEQEEIDSTLDRLKVLQDHLRLLKANNKFLNPAAWNEVTAREQTKDNSYLGEVRSESGGKVSKAINTSLEQAGLTEKSYRDYLKRPLEDKVMSGELTLDQAIQIAGYSAADFLNGIGPIEAEATTKRAEFSKREAQLSDPRDLQEMQTMATRFNTYINQRTEELASKVLYTYLS
jgi:hypothetical protein